MESPTPDPDGVMFEMEMVCVVKSTMEDRLAVIDDKSVDKLFTADAFANEFVLILLVATRNGLELLGTYKLGLVFNGSIRSKKSLVSPFFFIVVVGRFSSSCG